jgi:formylglycine-generating enzyme required for sulfatase activity
MRVEATGAARAWKVAASGPPRAVRHRTADALDDALEQARGVWLARRISRRQFLWGSTAAGLTVLVAWPDSGPAGELEPDLLGPRSKDGRLTELIHAPADPAQWPAWRQQLHRWRAEMRQALGYKPALYQRPEFEWVKTNFACAFVMLCDLTFYDPDQGRFTVDRFLDHGQREFGGYDSLVLWHAYPRIGFDPRNQFDFYRDMPGGLAGLRAVSRQCHARGVRVFLDYNPWDTGTRREPEPDLDALAELVAAVEADGIFLDTMDQGAAAFRDKLDAARPGVILESEGALPLERVHDHHASWAQGFRDSAVPGVLRNKWFERRHLQHQIQRWARDHAAELHCAWMNGSGMLIWENVFGSWVGWSERDRSLLRSMLPIQRRYAALFCGEGWTPLVPTLAPEVYASLWEGNGLRLWTVVNRSEQPRHGMVLQVRTAEDERVFDLVAGRQLRPNPNSGPPFGIELSLPGRGIGCVLAGRPETLGPDFSEFLASQAALHARANWEIAFPARRVQLRPVTRTTPRATVARAQPAPAQALSAQAPGTVPEGMVEIPAAQLTLQVEMLTRECGFYESVPVPGPDWGPLHRVRRFSRQVKLHRFAIDLTPVTNAAFARFVKATGYQPRHPENFLKHWHQGAPPPGQEDHPVVYVSLEDARAYAAWAGKRLPTEEEWQLAAGGLEQRRYPWGDELRPGCYNDGSSGGTTPVTAFPDGRSPFGCYDMCGNVWQWTESERQDGRTRFCILKGGSWFRARGSMWYADGGPVPCCYAAKFLLMWPGLDRCSTIGFRCVVDLPD